MMLSRRNKRLLGEVAVFLITIAMWVVLFGAFAAAVHKVTTQETPPAQGLLLRLT